MQTLDPFDPVEKLTLTERVYSELGRAIMMGKFQPGDTLTIRNLANSFGTSTQPIREAVNRLAAGKALAAYANRSIKLPRLSLEDVKTLWAVRAFIEGEAAAQAVMNATKNDKRKIENANRALLGSIAKRDIAQVVSNNHAFHFALYRAAHNEPLYGIIESLWLQSGPYLAFLYSAEKEASDQIEASTIEWHKRTLAALKSRDSEAARQAIAADIESAATVYANVYANAISASEESGLKTRKAAG